MPITDSPLRYPGGKSQLSPLVIDVLRANDLFYGEYVEPFAGGAGIAWRLLLSSYVSRVHINDLDPAIHAFWWAVLNRTEQLCDRIDSTEVTISEWRRQQQIQKSSRPGRFDLAFSTFFLNRTNRSGIINGGVIGGLGQDGDYLLDCRYNKSDLIRKIRRIAEQKDQIVLHRLDAAEFIRTVLPTLPNKTLVNIDPPYFAKGPELYRNYFTDSEHEELSRAIRKIKQPWMLTYDDLPETRKLYKKQLSFSQELNYSAQVKRIGIELLVFSPKIALPDSIDINLRLKAA